MNDIVVEVRGGVVVEVYANIEDARIILVDWDQAGDTETAGPVSTVFPHAPLASLPQETRVQYERARSTSTAEGSLLCG